MQCSSGSKTEGSELGMSRCCEHKRGYTRGFTALYVEVKAICELLPVIGAQKVNVPRCSVFWLQVTQPKASNNDNLILIMLAEIIPTKIPYLAKHPDLNYS